MGRRVYVHSSSHHYVEKVYMKIRILCVLIVLLILCTSCGKNIDENYVLSKDENSSIQKLCQYIGLSYEEIVTPILDEDIQEAINVKLMSSAEMLPIETRNYVTDGDSVYIDYVVSHRGKVVGVYNDVKFSVGEGAFDIDFENAIVGAEIGVTVTFDYLVKDSAHALYNQVVQIEATVTRIYSVEKPELSDEFVSKHFNVTTVAEFEQIIIEALIETRDAEDRIRNAYSILKFVCEGSTFTINKDELNSIRTSVVDNYTQIAYLYNMSLSEYIKEKLDMNQAEFDDYCTQEAVIMIEMNLVIDEIAKSENIGISNDELYEYANNKGYTQIDILKSSQLKKELEYEIIKNKVYDFLLLHSISQ